MSMHNAELESGEEDSVLEEPSISCSSSVLADTTSLDVDLSNSVLDEQSDIITDIDAAVEEASDIVCNTGLEHGSVVVENDDDTDAEDRRIARFLSQGCKCQLHNGNPCYTLFTASQLSVVRDECRQLSRDEMDMVVMGQLRALCQSDSLTQKTKAKNTERTRTATLFRFGGHRICQKMFLFLHAMSNTRFEAIKWSWRENGLRPRVRATVHPHNTTKLSDIKNVVRFILQYAEDIAILLPGRILGYKRDDLQLLPSSTTKREVWEMYHQSALATPDVKAVCYSLFCDLWNQLTPHVVVTRPMSDLCWICQKNSNLIMRAHNRPIEEKTTVINVYIQ